MTDVCAKGINGKEYVELIPIYFVDRSLQVIYLFFRSKEVTLPTTWLPDKSSINPLAPGLSIYFCGSVLIRGLWLNIV